MGLGNSLAVQWLGLRASTAGGKDSIPGWGTKILHAAQHSQKNKQTNKNGAEGWQARAAGVVRVVGVGHSSGVTLRLSPEW